MKIIGITVYSNLEDLNLKILELFKFDDTIIETMRERVYIYYQNSFSSKSIVNKIKNNDFSKIHIQAEGKSLESLTGNFS